MWQWHSKFMGGIQYKNNIPGGNGALLTVEEKNHPAMKGLPSSFITKDEWYIYDKNPIANVHLLASVYECTYNPGKKVKMGDHPVIWTNETVKALNIYIAMEHFPELFNVEAYTTLVRSAIFWAAKK